ncbi:hypothetical protein DFH94DRAFT_639069 [Russula ochroleuca]|uniref:Ubiquitin carboxyl-terminal hydrolase n=1 Tax=Russula ochroleuca TaxID=152965 RepID=A0A9P5MQK2_9AGAM|nr:hypothetical protein DFH94DRAFT_639069 [Russula ochroleuca]
MLAFLDELAQIDIRRTLPGLQHDFCTLWNELVQEAKKTPELIPEIFVYSWGDQPLLLERYKTALGGLVGILRQIRHLYIALHQGTDAAPTAFSASTDDSDRIFHRPSSYPLCDIASHRRGRPGSTAHVPVPNSRTVPLLIQSIVSPDAAPLPSSDSTTPGEIGESSRVPEATSPALPVHTSPRPTDASPATAIAAALQDLPPAATLSHPQEGTTQQNIVAPCAESDISRILSTSSAPVPTPTLLPVPVPTPYVLNEPLASSDAGAASAFNPLLPASSVIGFSVPSSPPTSRVSSLPNAEFLSLLCTTPSCPTGNTALPHLRARGLVNTGNMCFANAVLQLLVHSPPLWNLFRQLGDLKGLRVEGGPATGGGATPLVDATVRFFEEFMNKEKAPTGQVTGGKPREGIGAKKEPDAVDPFEPTYIYDAMKEKRKFKRLLDNQQQDAEEFFRLYLDALDEELLALLASSSGHDSTTATPGAEKREVSQSGQTDVPDVVTRGFTSVESPLMRIFGGKFRSTVRTPNQPDSITIEDWRSLQLDIQVPLHDSVYAIENALARVSHLQPVQLGPSGLGEASQQVLIEALPPVLVLHLKRFQYDVAADGIVKISKPVQFAPELEIPLEIMAPVSGKPAEPVHYKLYGVLYHHGESAGSGHYTVDVLHPDGDSGSGESWLHIDDEAVSAVRREDVFGDHNDERVDDRCAYMLFYCRTAPA